jgi:lipoteichoic acid synthase
MTRFRRPPLPAHHRIRDLPARLLAGISREDLRATLVGLGPFAIALLAVCVKLGYFNFFLGQPVENDWLYAWSRRETAWAMVGSIGTLMIVCAPLVFFSPAGRLLTLLALNLATTLVVLSNILHFRYFGDVISVSALGAAWQIPLVAASVFELMTARDAILVVVDIVLLAAFWPFDREVARKGPPFSRRMQRSLAVGLCATGIALVAAIPVRTVQSDNGSYFGNALFRHLGVRKIGLLNYHLYEGTRLIWREWWKGREVGPGDRALVDTYLAESRRRAAVPTPLTGIAQGKNVILVAVESLQSFPIGLQIEGRAVAPNLDALARRSMHYAAFYGQTWEGSTSDGVFTSLQSLHPLPAGAVATTYPTNRYRALPALLAERGYVTVSAVADFGDLWNMRQLESHLGFQHMLFRENFERRDVIGMAISDGEFFRQMLPRLEALPRPFLLHLLTCSMHLPFDLPDRYRTLGVGEFEGTPLGKYLQAVHYFDSVFGELLERLESDGLLDQSVLVVYGDHKAWFGHNADFKRLLERHAGFPPRTPGFDYRHWQAQNQVALLIRLPDDESAGKRSITGGHLDIPPTVLDLLGIRDPDVAMLGRPLTQEQDSFVVFRDGSFVNGQTLCRVGTFGPDSVRCWNTASGAALDPTLFQEHFEAARKQLAVSDLILRGDLIPGPTSVEPLAVRTPP